MHTQYLSLPYRKNSEDYFLALRDLPLPVFLHSGSASDARFDILSANPVKSISLDPNQSQPEIYLHDEIERALKQYTTHPDDVPHAQDAQTEQLPFCSGAIGFLDYSTCEQFMGIAGRQLAAKPANFVGIYQWALVQDHQHQSACLVADPKLLAANWQQLCARFTQLKTDKPAAFALVSDWQTPMDERQYRSAFEQLQRYIQAGDCYQANLTRRFSARYCGDTYTAYSALAAATKAPFGAYFETPEFSIASCSPERFIQIHNGDVLTQPIKGTRPRGHNPSEDTRHIADLSGSTKDRAENLMIVDLMRNDLGKNSVNGSIAVPRLFEIKSYSNVHHMVSSITGKIAANDISASLKMLLGCLPGGSITGAPKKRAMEIIAKLEPSTRSIYCGSAFYLNSKGNMDSNIMIRSLLFSKDDQSTAGSVHCWGGGGIVADSELENELKESFYKISNLLDIMDSFKPPDP